MATVVAIDQHIGTPSPPAVSRDRRAKSPGGTDAERQAIGQGEVRPHGLIRSVRALRRIPIPQRRMFRRQNRAAVPPDRRLL
jgi:hypothetical protein